MGAGFGDLPHVIVVLEESSLDTDDEWRSVLARTEGGVLLVGVGYRPASAASTGSPDRTARTGSETPGLEVADSDRRELDRREHELLSVGNTAAYWLRVRLVDPKPGQPTYQVSPRVRAIIAETLGGTVSAEHAENVPGEVIGLSDGRPAQAFVVSRVPVLPRRDGEIVVVTDTDGSIEWTEVEDFTRSGAKDRHYVWEKR